MSAFTNTWNFQGYLLLAVHLIGQDAPGFKKPRHAVPEVPFSRGLRLRAFL